VEVGQIQPIEVREAELPARSLEGDGEGDRLTDRQTHDADSLAAELRLLRPRDLVPVAVGAELDELLLVEHVDEPARPRVVDPDAVSIERLAADVLAHEPPELLAAELAARVSRPDQVLDLGGDRVEGLDAIVADELFDPPAIAGVARTQALGAPGPRRVGAVMHRAHAGPPRSGG